MLEFLKKIQKSNKDYMVKLGLKDKTIKSKMKAIDDFIMYIGISLAIHNPDILNAFRRKDNE